MKFKVFNTNCFSKKNYLTSSNYLSLFYLIKSNTFSCFKKNYQIPTFLNKINQILVFILLNICKYNYF